MPRKIIQKWLPDPDVILESKLIKFFGPILHSPSLWHINRRSCSGAVAVGLFSTFIPIPFQMILATFLAIVFRVHILIPIPIVWITNPITIPPIYYFCYKLGAWLLNIEPSETNLEVSTEWLMNGIAEVWQPLLTGCLFMSIVTAILGYIAVQFFWRYHIWTYIKRKRERSS